MKTFKDYLQEVDNSFDAPGWNAGGENDELPRKKRPPSGRDLIGRHATITNDVVDQESGKVVFKIGDSGIIEDAIRNYPNWFYVIRGRYVSDTDLKVAAAV